MHRDLILALGLLLGTLAASSRADPAAILPIDTETAGRAKPLQADLKNFQVHFAYVPAKGGDRGEYPSVTLRVPAFQEKRMANWPAFQIDEEQALRLLDHLSESGWLARAECVDSPFRDRILRVELPGPAYTLTVSAGGWAYQERLFFNAQCLWRLMELAAAVGGDAAGEMEKVTLTQLAEKQPGWQRAGEVGRVMVKELNVWLVCTGPQAEGLFRVWFFTGKAPPSLPQKGEVWVRPDAHEVSLLVNALSATGVLEALVEAAADARPPAPGFTITVTTDRRKLLAPLGWDARMRTVLEAMADRLRPNSLTRQALDELLNRLEPMRSEWDQAAGLAPAPIDWNKAGDYAFGPWKYVYRLASDREGTVIGRWGHIYYRGARVEGIDLGDTLWTPWGTLQWVGVTEKPDGSHGWMRDVKADPARPIPSVRDAIGFHEMAAHQAGLLIVLVCRKERLWANFRPPDVQGQPEPREGVRVISLSSLQQRAALSHLAHAGLLSKAEPDWSRWMISDDYELQFFWPVGDNGKKVYTINLGLKAEAIARLTALRAVWDGQPATTLGDILERLNHPPVTPIR